MKNVYKFCMTAMAALACLCVLTPVRADDPPSGTVRMTSKSIAVGVA